MKKSILILVNKKGVVSQRFKKEFIKVNNIKTNINIIFEEYNNVEFLFERDNVKALINEKDITKFDLVYFRSFDKHKDIVTSMSKILKHSNTKFFDTIFQNNILSNKLHQNVIFAINNIQIPKSIYIPLVKLKEKIIKIENHLAYPLIMKPIQSHQGKNNFLINSRDELLEKAEMIGSEFIFQEFITNDFDYRLIVTDYKKIKSIIKRIRVSNINEHRNNTKIGATEVFIKPRDLSTEIHKTAIKASKLMHIEIAGVDIVKDKNSNEHYLLEVNDTPGLTYNSLESETVLKFIYKSIK